MAAPPPTLDAGQVRQLVDHARRAGLSQAALLRVLGCSARELERTGARLPLESWYGLLEWCAQALGDPALGVQLALGENLDDFEPLTWVLATAPDLRTGLRIAERLQHLWGEGERFSVHEEGELGLIHLELWGPARLAHHLAAQAYLVECARAGPALFRRPWGPRWVATPEPPGPGTDALAAAVQAPVRCRASDVVFAFERAVLDQPLPSARPALHRELVRQATARFEAVRATTALVDRVQAALEERLGDGTLTVGAVARHLGTAPRTLQRQLSREGVRFAGLLQQVRQRRAESLLRRGESITEIALQLGYSEVSAFSRAYRRWTGRSPVADRADPPSG